MPIIKSALKKLKQDHAQTKRNRLMLRHLQEALKSARKETSKKTLSSAFSVIDTAAKKHVIHQNKAARLKSGLSKLMPIGKVSKSAT